MTPGDELLFLALGGSGEIGMNVNLYGCRGKWLMVDLGLTFADPYYPGIDLVLPDLEFIEERQKDLVGIVLTHGHEDHIGAIPYLADELKVPLYATPFTAGLIREKLEAEGLTGQLNVKTIPRDGGIDLAPFNVRFVALSHSIPEGNGVLIDTPHGKIFHTGDWKIDEKPVLGTTTGDEAMRMIGDEGVRALVCDSTNAFQDSVSGTEEGVHDGLKKAVEAADGRVLVTTFASNAARLETLGKIAVETGRTLCVAGRSLDRIIRVAQSTGYLTDFPETVRFEEAMDIPKRNLMIIATGGQGEPRAALARIARGDHQLKLAHGDTVIFSSKQIPGNELAIGRIMNQLSDMGVTMITEKQHHVHVSGHPGRPELKQMYDWIRPDILVPVHGEMRHMREQAKLGLDHGIPHAVVQRNGDVIRLAPGDPRKVDEVRTGRLILDGDVILPADGLTINQRRKLGYQGVIAVALPIDGSDELAGEVEVRALGLPVEADADDFIADLADAAAKNWQSGLPEEKAAEKVRLAVRRAANLWTGKKPVVEVMLVAVD